MNKILKLFIIIFSAVILIELVYVFLLNPQTSLTKTADLNRKVDNSTLIKLSPGKSQNVTYEMCKSVFFPSSDKNQAFGEDQLNNLRVLRKSLIRNSTLNYQLVGRLQYVRIVEEQPVPKIKFNLIGDENQLTNFTYTESSILTVKSKEGNIISLLDLKKDETISIDVEFDMLQEAYLKVEISVL